MAPPATTPAPLRLGLRKSGLALAISCAVATGAHADEGGVSFWLPGLFASMAATPQQPGWSLSTFGYHTSVSAGANVALSREFTLGRIPANLDARLDARLHGAADLAAVVPGYVFASPFLGAQAAIGMMGVLGRANTSIAGTLKGTLETSGGVLPFTRSDGIADRVSGFGDLYPQIALRWNKGLHNYMTYATGDIPVGANDSNRLSNIGLGHGALDAGGGYTYFNADSGHELSGVLGFTYNFANPSTNYQSGVDMHFDWGASKFIDKQLQIGLVGYAYRQLGCDSGSGDRIGCFQSQVLGVGPQAGIVIPMGDVQGYVNVKAYKEFAPQNRPAGWNAWVTFVISPAAAAGEKQVKARF